MRRKKAPLRVRELAKLRAMDSEDPQAIAEARRELELDPGKAEKTQWSVLLGSECEHWNTPAIVLETLLELWPDGIDLDPCTNDGSLVPAAKTYTKAEDGLTRPWAGRVFVNPPYGRGVLAWLERAHLTAQEGGEVAMLLPARVDTAWFHTYGARADAVCFWRGRLTFVGAPDPAPFPSAVLYYGRARARFARVFSQHGLVWRAPDGGELEASAQLGLF